MLGELSVVRIMWEDLRGAVGAGLLLGCPEQVERRSDVAGPGRLEPAGRP